MTVRPSNLQWAILSDIPASGRMSIADFQRYDQRVASSMGKTKNRVKPPWFVKAGDYIVLTPDGQEVKRLMAHSNVMRAVARQSLPLAHCFDRASHSRVVLQMIKRRVA